MVVMSSPSSVSPAKILELLKEDISGVRFREGSSFRWSPKDKIVYYRRELLNSDEGTWALIHEAGHAKLGHATYGSDFELLQMESGAWQEAVRIGDAMGIVIDVGHIEDCLDTYRDWLHKRSKCPLCGSTSLQANSTRYRCHNCMGEWQVSSDRFCRPYRKRRI